MSSEIKNTNIALSKIENIESKEHSKSKNNNKLNSNKIPIDKVEKISKTINNKITLQKLPNSKQIFTKININTARNYLNLNSKVLTIFKKKENIKIQSKTIEINNGDKYKKINEGRNINNLKYKGSNVKNLINIIELEKESDITNNNILSKTKTRASVIKKNNIIKSSTYNSENKSNYKGDIFNINQLVSPMTIEMEKFKRSKKYELKKNNYIKCIPKNKTNINYINYEKSKKINTAEQFEKKEKKNNSVTQINLKLDIDNNTTNNINHNTLTLSTENNDAENHIKKYKYSLTTKGSSSFNNLNIKNRHSGHSAKQKNKKKNLTKSENKNIFTSNNSASKNNNNNIKKNFLIKRAKLEKSLNIYKEHDKNEIINKKIEKVYNDLNKYKKSNLENIFPPHSEKKEIRDINKNKNINNNKNKENIELIKKRKEKENSTRYRNNKFLKILNIYDKYHQKIILSHKKFILNRLVVITNNNKKKQSIKIIKQKINNKYNSIVKYFFNCIKRHINNKIKLNKTKKIISSLLNYIKNKKSYFFKKFKNYIIINKKLEAAKSIYNILSKNIFNKKIIAINNIKNFLIKSKKKSNIEKIFKIINNKILINKKIIFTNILLYYNKIRRKESIFKIKNLAIKLRKKKFDILLHFIKSYIKHKSQLKKSENIGIIISDKIFNERKNIFNKIKKYVFIKRKIEGINRVKDIYLRKRIQKIRIIFNEFIINIKKQKISIAYGKISNIFISNKIKIKNNIFQKLKRNYKQQIKIIKFFSILTSFISEKINSNKSYSFILIKNFINKKKISKKERWKNNTIDNTIYSIQIDSKNSKNIKNEILSDKKTSFSISTNKLNFSQKTSRNFYDNDYSDNEKEVWTTCLEKWKANPDINDSFYQIDNK